MHQNNTCLISSWSFDGFGHQLINIVRCQEYALQYNYTFVGTQRTHMEHKDPDKSKLLELLTTISGKERYQVPHRRYHDRTCGIGCDPISLCDECHSTPNANIRRRIARTLCASIPMNRTVSCPVRYACFHVRQRQSWEKDRWLVGRRPDLNRMHLANHTRKAVITHGRFDDLSVFKADFCIFSTMSFVQNCCESFEALSASSFGDTLKMVHQYCG